MWFSFNLKNCYPFFKYIYCLDKCNFFWFSNCISIFLLNFFNKIYFVRFIIFNLLNSMRENWPSRDSRFNARGTHCHFYSLTKINLFEVKAYEGSDSTMHSGWKGWNQLLFNFGSYGFKANFDRYFRIIIFEGRAKVY